MSLSILMVGCATRYKLSDADLREADQQNALARLRVYPSNRTISSYDEPTARTVVVSREIRERSYRGRPNRILTRNTSGAVVARGELNGARLLWVTFDPQCATAECAYGFVQHEDARYLLVHVPELEGFAPPKVYRGCRLKRHRMSIGHLRALAEANKVYRLKRKSGRHRPVFLEIKRDVRDRVRDSSRREPGV